MAAEARGERPILQRLEDRGGERFDIAFGQASLALRAPEPRRERAKRLRRVRFTLPAAEDTAS